MKIGISIDPFNKRFKTIKRQIKDPNLILLSAMYFHKPFLYERFLHQKYKKFRKKFQNNLKHYGTEWFDGQILKQVQKDINIMNPLCDENVKNVFNFSIITRDWKSSSKFKHLIGSAPTLIFETTPEYDLIPHIKNFLDDVLDHKMILDINDPLNEENTIWVLDDDGDVDPNQLIYFPEEHYWIPDMSKIVESMEKLESDPLSNPKNKAIYEKYEGIVFVDFVPTSENISAWLLKIAKNKMKDIPNVEVVAVEFWETPKSHCRVEY